MASKFPPKVNTIDQDQFQLVQQLLDRQDQTLEQLDQLNADVEAAILQLTEARKQELLLEEAGESSELLEIEAIEHDVEIAADSDSAEEKPVQSDQPLKKAA